MGFRATFFYVSFQNSNLVPRSCRREGVRSEDETGGGDALKLLPQERHQEARGGGMKAPSFAVELGDSSGLSILESDTVSTAFLSSMHKFPSFDSPFFF